MRKHLLAAAIIGGGISLWLGFLDYETTSWTMLFSGENLPALLLFTFLFGSIAFFFIRLIATIVEFFRTNKGI